MVKQARKVVLRLDKWLWYARFFKTRTLASKAISNGRFQLDGAVMLKPHRQARCGQVLTFAQGARTRVVKIKELGTCRRPASEAVLLFDDLAPLMPELEKTKTLSTPVFENRKSGDGRPTKRQRRETDHLKSVSLVSEK